MDERRRSILAALFMTSMLAFSLLPALPAADAATAQLPPVEYAPVNNVTLGYRSYGSGEPLLLICGFGATQDQWNATFVSLLATHFRVITYDHRGMGYSSYGNTSSSIAQYADDAVALMHYLGYASMNTYGTSMGSTVSQQIVISHPDAVRKMVLSSATYDVRIPECQLLLDILVFQSTNMNQTQGVRDEATANLNWSGSWSLLPSIQTHIMLIVGTADILTPDPVSVQIASQINGSWVMRFTGIPHSGQSYAPVQYAQGVTVFLGVNEAPYQSTAPGVPINLCAPQLNSQVCLEWLPPMTTGNMSISGYNVYRSASVSGPFVLIGSTLSTYYNDSTADNGATYWYKVSASNAVGTGMYSNIVKATPQGSSAAMSTELFGAVIVILVLLLVLVIVVWASRKKQ